MNPAASPAATPAVAAHTPLKHLMPGGFGIVMGWSGLALAWGWVAGAAALSVVCLTANLALQYGAARLPANPADLMQSLEMITARIAEIRAALGEDGVANDLHAPNDDDDLFEDSEEA